MDQTPPARPDLPNDAGQDDPSIQRRGRAFFKSMTVIWATVILLGIVFLALIIAFAVIYT